MGSIRPYGRHRTEVLDVVAEMSYWRQEFCSHDMIAADYPFGRYEHAFRFAYDAYLSNHELALDILTGSLQMKYSQQFDQWTRLPVQDVEKILRRVWMRMGGTVNRPDVTTSGHGESLEPFQH